MSSETVPCGTHIAYYLHPVCCVHNTTEHAEAELGMKEGALGLA